MEMREEQQGGVTTLAVKGHLDSTTAPLFGEKLELIVASPDGRLVVDFGQLEYMSSAGFRMLLVAEKRAGQVGSRLVLCGLSAKVRQLFDLGGFLDLFTIVQSHDDAVAAAAK